MKHAFFFSIQSVQLSHMRSSEPPSSLKFHYIYEIGQDTTALEGDSFHALVIEQISLCQEMSGLVSGPSFGRY